MCPPLGIVLVVVVVVVMDPYSSYRGKMFLTELHSQPQAAYDCSVLSFKFSKGITVDVTSQWGPCQTEPEDCPGFFRMSTFMKKLVSLTLAVRPESTQQQEIQAGTAPLSTQCPD